MTSLTHNTLIRNLVLATVAIVAGGFFAATQARSTDATFLTFSKDIALPGIVLPAGTYRFEMANPDSSGDVVRVSNRSGKLQYLGFTLRVPRPAGVSATAPVTFKEARSDTPVPINAWYPLGASTGHQFMYR
jgi:hypothetical protein